MQYKWSFSAAVLNTFFIYLVVIANLTWYVFAAGFVVFPFIKTYASKDRLWIVPNAPDGNGGLAPIGAVAFAMASTLASGIPMLVVGILLYGAPLPFLLGGGLYCLVITITFFAPLMSVHEAMRRAKDSELGRIALLFRHEYEKLPDPTSKPKTEPSLELSHILDLMSKLESVYKSVKAMPVWPFDLATLQKFLLIIATPAISVLAKTYWPSGFDIGIADTWKGFLHVFP